MQKPYKAKDANYGDHWKYRGYIITPPDGWPDKWLWAHDSYDGAPDSNDNRCGWADSLEEAAKAIDENINDNYLDPKTCPECGGEGKVPSIYYSADPETCDYCDGKGIIEPSLKDHQ